MSSLLIDGASRHNLATSMPRELAQSVFKKFKNSVKVLGSRASNIAECTLVVVDIFLYAADIILLFCPSILSTCPSNRFNTALFKSITFVGALFELAEINARITSLSFNSASGSCRIRFRKSLI